MATHDPLPLVVAPLPEPLKAQEFEALAELFGNWEEFAKDVLPPISPLAPRLFALDSNADDAGTELTEIIESDPVLTARILGLANAAAFATPGKAIFEVKGALMRLGLEAAFEAAFSQLMALWLCHVAKLPEPTQLRALWLEYLITGAFAREVAKRVPDDDLSAPLAYAAGLLHDVGTLALSHVEPRLMSRFMQTGYGVDTPLREPFVEAHTKLGAALLRHWNTPAELSEAAARHHAGFGSLREITTIVVFLADHLHEEVLGHSQSRLQPPEKFQLGCDGGLTEDLDVVVASLELAGGLDAIVGHVAAESERIEALAAAVAG